MSEIVVEDSSSDPDEIQEVSDSGEEEEGSRVFVSKKIPTDSEWFSQVRFHFLVFETLRVFYLSFPHFLKTTLSSRYLRKKSVTNKSI